MRNLTFTYGSFGNLIIKNHPVSLVVTGLEVNLIINLIVQKWEFRLLPRILRKINLVQNSLKGKHSKSFSQVLNLNQFTSAYRNQQKKSDCVRANVTIANNPYLPSLLFKICKVVWKLITTTENINNLSGNFQKS